MRNRCHVEARRIGAAVLAAALIAIGCSVDAGAQQRDAMIAVGNPAPMSTPGIGSTNMQANKKIAENVAAAPNLSALFAAVQAAGLIDTLINPGPLTLFAPTNAAFARLAPGTVEMLLKPENKAALVRILRYHIVPGAITTEQIRERVKAGGGKARYTSIDGEPLVIQIIHDAISITDANGNKSYIETANLRQANGVVHIVGGALIPKLD
ncbi:MAG: hypothetical protein BVN33_07300 [Proteobacteria bacterium ST_bin13]|nr:MAG: hypothetical protein BVN33_07300 [Proteobacteria bacterium ST_bin13]